MERKNIKELSKKNTPRDVFLHLLAVVTLYWSAISFVTLLWQFVDYYFPDKLNFYYYSGLPGPIRFAVASLIIVFPIFILVSWYLNRIYRKDASVRGSKIRKWLIYLTLFVASLVIIGDLVTIINNFLGGSTTISFVLKSLAILLAAGFIFGYYLDDVRREKASGSLKYFAWVAGILVLVSVVGAFFIVGTPMSARLMQYDQQKISDLQDIQSQIVDYWQVKGSLPASLADLNNSISGFVPPIDSQTNTSYEYRTTSTADLSFELCATFNRQGSDQYVAPVPAGSLSQNWQHNAGRVCFQRTIDRQFYPLFNLNK